MCYKDFKYFYITHTHTYIYIYIYIYCRLRKIGNTIKLLFRSRLQLLYTRLKFYVVLVKLNTGVVYYCVLSFRAEYCTCCVVIFWLCFNSSIKCGFFGDNHQTGSIQ